MSRATPPLPLRRAGRTGLQLPAITLGLWQNFGEATPFTDQRALVLAAVDAGVVHLDLANNYGPPPGAAEESVGRLLASDLRPYRDQLLLATKAGYRQWPGPYGEFGSRKYLLASLDQSLRRLGTDYVDVFYSHRYDPDTPLEETLGALKTAVDSGKALYAGISSYSAERTAQALAVADRIGLTLSLHQPSYSMLNRWIERPGEDGRSLLDVVGEAGMGVVAFSPLAQGMLSTKYLHGVPEDSRAATGSSLQADYLSEENLAHVRALNEVAGDLGVSLPQLAIAWVLRDQRISSVTLGARTPAQLAENLASTQLSALSEGDLARIEEHAVDAGINLWGARSSEL
ncbi:aldo/keto reductase [Cellulomonas sp. NPDC089187]|uniref:aldo/keto reductase n=1 Tax=Cellulomonas sp. NPDC089187 TaxID=3154970 RepID=UPI003427F9C1